MYLVAGAITIIWSAVILFFMPPDPIRARCLNERERYIAVARLRVNNSGVRNTHFKKEQVFELLVDVKFWVVFAMAFLIMIANGPVSSFTPIIIAGFGYNTLNSLLLVMPAGAIIGSIGKVCTPTLSDTKLARARGPAVPDKWKNLCWKRTPILLTRYIFPTRTRRRLRRIQNPKSPRIHRVRVPAIHDPRLTSVVAPPARRSGWSTLWRLHTGLVRRWLRRAHGHANRQHGGLHEAQCF
jgi:hypothetical protein